MSVKSVTETRRQASAWKATTSYKFFAATRDTMARPKVSTPFLSTRIPTENAALYAFQSAAARDAFIADCAGQAEPVDA